MSNDDRLNRLLSLMGRQGLDGVFIGSLPNIFYLSGFTGSSAFCLVTARRRILLTDSRYSLQAAREAPDFEVITVEGRELFPSLREQVLRLKLKSLGFEAHAVTYAIYRRLKNAVGGIARLRAAPPLLEKIRMVKSGAEIRRLKKLARMTDLVLGRCISGVKKNLEERELSDMLRGAAAEAGGAELAFKPIVAFGANAAMPHHRPSRRRLAGAGPVIVDFGISSRGYNSDLTRTFHWGRVTARYRKIYDIVLKAQQLALQAIKPGVAAPVVDARAREYIASRGFGRMFGHSLGHGVGVQIHEAPRLSSESNDILEEGMVFTVEPGIYVPGWGGVRIEDMVLVERDGYSLLTSSSKGIGESLL